ncbi:hypothetical protein [Pseudacidovorax sp. RU35E]|uniref:hypothetical protein n=1 Tax=Pseudacidovorax sp. RU35E TaxID=1907403 RepID=UPI000956F8A8|nr:hypothetical protein [Pseudacidovorax sp. RU35E]SIR00364.1 hypothetical protein SAMN05880557_10793 [Pseudacidovorax sp. RU35E]
MEPKLFYDDEIDALRAHVQAMGGTKEVAARIWPDKTPMAAQRQLSDCLNANRSERLSPSQLLLLMRLGREQGVHILAEYLMGEAGYSRPIPLDPKDEASQLLAKFDECMSLAGQLATRMERMRAFGGLKAVG